MAERLFEKSMEFGTCILDQFGRSTSKDLLDIIQVDYSDKIKLHVMCERTYT